MHKTQFLDPTNIDIEIKSSTYLKTKKRKRKKKKRNEGNCKIVQACGTHRRSPDKRGRMKGAALTFM